ncbi:replicative DNA helicase [Lentilactobacillus hilgardii]|uniref:Replicative DNA helicase n=1 Tax=Lentilactobacillus hilgardii (strain ATCC 8290 / DSM 20176 / CCUG 30140 / JCM 1155 / KCTC 3500 / NBRC 15886 / NCIMB 8040 / NRRL B-1843 / 9) TaxID=1423757 RepID=C0XIK0_LENH9|nr:replicative DNA helicase [Lentilactobacillus hilgardii]EEI20959.1 replicative DNA helicase [Lentilactobacillus buchneri ATCC 11577]EEI24770.1 replicative DNA helicase [Lentilactobacillus hilgardii DSM 20176 = ATCC 8290]KRK57664.1 replicative DNA helicase DnaB [Lentilactobacillus hilgardii DSM 20176 = ATCC 8290]MCP9333998.1 replicative DNA helicase [Lentilactobacillus hilgardii]MCP9350617.1 replicative DNA helicase [Lentilactobacillus hilgardii]
MNNDLVNQVPPQNIEAEKAVLGSIFLSTDALIDAMEYLDPNDFYKHSHQIIFQAMVKLNDDDQAVDGITVTDMLKDQNNLDDVGGYQYITELANAVPTAANVTYYAKIVKDKAILRRLIQTATNIVTDGYNTDEDVTTVLDNAERDIMNVAEDRNQSGFKAIKDVLNSAFNKIDELSQEGETVTGLSTGYPELDKITTGLHNDELVILAARPAVGKTAFALNVAQNVGTKTDKTVAIFSLEMSAESLVDRMLCSEGSINANHLRTGQLTEDEWQNLVVAMGSLSRANIFIDDTAGIKMSEIRAKCRRLAKENGNLGLIVIDYLQLIEGGQQENRQQEVSYISRQLKKLAKELHVPVISLSQLSRGVEQRQDKRPVLSDIRESGSIEQDADIVAFLYRDDYYERDDDDDSDSQGADDENDVGEVEVIIEKNRSGPRGTVKLLFVKSYNKFSSISYAQDGG